MSRTRAGGLAGLAEEADAVDGGAAGEEVRRDEASPRQVIRHQLVPHLPKVLELPSVQGSKAHAAKCRPRNWAQSLKLQKRRKAS
eukprot:4391019-Alexandrium_andersonii.AAC.1